jgi:methionyl-tRNA synthetase
MHWGGMSLINMPFWVPSFLLLLVPFVFVFIVWSVFWKGLALWHSARRGEPWWFLAILFINTLGILEIVYLFFIAKLKIDDLFSTHSHHHSGH